MVCAACNGVFSELGPNNTCPVCWETFKPKSVVVPAIPPIELNVADQGTGSVPTVSTPVANADTVISVVEERMARAIAGEPVPELLGKPVATYGDVMGNRPKRQPVDHQTSRLYWPFIILMGKIAHYANEKYGSVEQYADGRLEGEKSPINHICGHIADYVARKPHDKFGNLQMQLAAIAYNAMMECVYVDQGGGPTVPSKLYDSVQKGQEK